MLIFLLAIVDRMNLLYELVRFKSLNTIKNGFNLTVLSRCDKQKYESNQLIFLKRNLLQYGLS